MEKTRDEIAEYLELEQGMGKVALAYLYRFTKQLQDAGIPSASLEDAIRRMGRMAQRRAQRGKRPLKVVAGEVGARYGWVVEDSGKRDPKGARSRALSVAQGEDASRPGVCRANPFP